MARVPYLDADDLDPDDRDLLKRPIALHRALVNSPGGARAFGQMGSWIRFKSKLDPRLRELAILQVGYVARSPYEWSHHIKIGYDFGVSDDDIRALIAETDGPGSDLPALDRAVLRAAREAAIGGGVSASTYAELNQTLSDELMVELTLVISFYCCVVRALASLKIDVEPDYEPYLAAFPLPPTPIKETRQ
jgi:alkylhydroperoxidase family enzyme